MSNKLVVPCSQEGSDGVTSSCISEKISNFPLVTIVTVVRNGAKYLKCAIESIISQSYKNIEYIIIDGGSTDGTLEIIKQYEFAVKLWISESDNGIYDAMNKGINLAGGSIIGILNSDDWYEPDTVELVVATFVAQACDVVTGDMMIWKNSSEFVRVKPNISWPLVKYGIFKINHPATFVTRDVYLDYSFDINYSTAADLKFLLQLILIKKKFSYLDKILVNFRTGGASSNSSLMASVIQMFWIRKDIGVGNTMNGLLFIYDLVHKILAVLKTFFRR
ncbi:MAG TPA: glycosyltransferase [Candidatus Andersenbacteria bacterium]|nr:glycosyltransferase [Candidatus Andersenbacteria bacterium]